MDTPTEGSGKSPPGAIWRKCVFQINPYQYLVNHASDLVAQYTDEDHYNQVLIQALIDNGVSIIGLADHWAVSSGETLRRAAMCRHPRIPWF